MSPTKWRIRLSLLWVLLSATWASYLCAPLFDFDLYGALASGRWIAFHRTLPAQDLWTLQGGEHLLTDLTWLYDLVVFLIRELTWDLGLIGLKFGLIWGALLGLRSLFRQLTEQSFFASTLALVVATSMFLSGDLSGRFTAIALIPIWLSLFVANATSQLRTSLLLVLAIIAINFHPVFALALVVASSLEKTPRRLWPLAAFGFALPFLTPNFFVGGLQAYRTLFAVAVSSDMPTGISVTQGIAVILGVFALTLALAERRVGVGVLGILLALTGLVVPQATSIAVFLIGVVLCVVWRQAQSQVFSRFSHACDRLEKILHALPVIGVIWFAGCFLLVSLVQLAKQPLVDAALPRRAVDFIIVHKIPRPIFHEPRVGEYLKYTFVDDQGELDQRILFDLRSNQMNRAYYQELRGELLDSSLTPSSATRGIGSILCHERESLCLKLESSPEWHVAYQDPGRDLLSDAAQRFLPRWKVLVRTNQLENG